MWKRVLLLFVTTGLLVASVVPAAAQRTTASLRGTITDSTHAIVRGTTSQDSNSVGAKTARRCSSRRQANTIAAAIAISAATVSQSSANCAGVIANASTWPIC